MQKSTRTLGWAAACLGLAVVAVGCSSDEGEGQPTGPDTSSSSSSGQSSSSGESSSSGGSSGSSGSSGGSSGTQPGGPFARTLPPVYASDVAPVVVTDEFDAETPVVWSLQTVPSGSEASVPSGTTSGFRPDLPGLYVLAAAGTKGGVARTGTLTLNAVEAELISTRVTYSATGQPAAFGVRAGGAIAGPARDVGCARATVSATSDEFTLLNAFTSGLATWYGPAGTPTRLVYTYSPPGESAPGKTTSLVAALATSPCEGANAPVPVAPLREARLGNASFRADGQRVAYFDTVNSTRKTYFTVGFDGSSSFELGSLDNARGRPAWRPDGSLATLVATGASTWSIQVFADSVVMPNPPAAAWMTCTGTPNLGPASTLLFLDDEHVVVGYRTAGGVDSIAVMHPGSDPARTCVVDRTLIQVGGPIANVYGYFTLSTSKKLLALVAESNGQPRAYVVPVDGSGLARSMNTILGLPADAADDLVGPTLAPNWLGTDALLAWSSGTKITSARTDGTPIVPGAKTHTIDITSAPSTYLGTSGASSTCAVGIPGGRASGGAAAVIGALALLVGRRRRGGAPAA